MRDIIQFIGIISIGMVIAGSILCGIGIGLDYVVCRSQSTAMGLSYSYGPLQGCMVTVGDRVFPIDQYLSVNVKG